MPITGSQIVLCDLPVRFDTYNGCSHACRYCFVNRKRDISQIKNGETAESLERFIKGQRGIDLKWLDWNIPIHFGGMSDPFQPIERQRRRTLDALRVFEKYQYPFVISTKNALIAEEPYLSIIKNCNVVVQFSAVCAEYDKIERGASTFFERLEAARLISPYKRVIFRVQPYLPQFKRQIIESVRLFAQAGAYGITIEGMKYIKKVPGTVKVGGDNCYPSELLMSHYLQIKEECHKVGMRFYCAENRLRNLGDDLCCCGVDGLGWKVNKGNLVHIINKDCEYSEAQKKETVCYLLANIKQNTLSRELGKNITYEQFMNMCSTIKAEIEPLKPGYAN